jgi:uncharacterized membrane protein
MRDLGSLRPSAPSEATAVSGTHVIGSSAMSSDHNSHRSHAFAYDLGAAHGRMQDLGTTGGSRSWGYAVDGNLVVGLDARVGDGIRRAFAYDLGLPHPLMQDLGTLGGDSSSAVAVDGNIVVGSSDTASGESHATAWTVSRTTAPVLKFDRASLSVQENVSRARLTVTRAGDSSRPVSVHYDTKTALPAEWLQGPRHTWAEPGTDFTATSGTLSFAAGQTHRYISVPIRNDRVPEGRETVLLTLGSSTGAVLGTPNAAALYIRTSDQQPDAQISTRPATRYVGDDIYNTTGARQTRTVPGHRSHTSTFYVRVYNDGSTANVIAVHGSRSWPGSTVRYYQRTDITRAMRTARGVRFLIGRRGYRTVIVRISIGAEAAIGPTEAAAVTATWTGDGPRLDRVRAQVTLHR